MLKNEFLNELSDKSGFTKKDSAAFLEAFIEAVKEALENGEDVKLVGFGTFKSTLVEERERRNPKTQEIMICPEKRTVKFKFSKAFVDSIQK